MQYPQLVLGMLAIFTYVGVEVTIQSNLGELLKVNLGDGLNPIGFNERFRNRTVNINVLGRPDDWSLGRSNCCFQPNSKTKDLAVYFSPHVGFGVVLFVNYISGFDVSFCFAFH